MLKRAAFRGFIRTLSRGISDFFGFRGHDVPHSKTAWDLTWATKWLTELCWVYLSKLSTDIWQAVVIETSSDVEDLGHSNSKSSLTSKRGLRTYVVIAIEANLGAPALGSQHVYCVIQSNPGVICPKWPYCNISMGRGQPPYARQPGNSSGPSSPTSVMCTLWAKSLACKG